MVLVRYYSPYSSRTRVSLWPRILAVFLVVVVLGTGGVAAWAFKSQSDTTLRNNTAATAHAGTVVALGSGTSSVAGAQRRPRPAAQATRHAIGIRRVRVPRQHPIARFRVR